LVVAITAPASARDYDFCSSAVIRPDQNFKDPSTCTRSYSDEEIAAGAEAVWLGDFTDVAHPVIPAPGRACMPSPSHASNAVYVNALKQARARVGGPPLWIVHMHRFELVPSTFAALPPFRASYLLRATKPFIDVTGFFANDRSPSCLAKPCRWSDSWGGVEGHDVGNRLRDWIDRSGGANSYQSVDYYLARPDATNVFWATSVMANLTDPAYRAWRVAEAKEALNVGGYNLVDLNHKIPHYLFGPHAIGTSTFPNVASLQTQADTAWSAQPSGYGYPQYMQGLVSLARDLRAGGVPYSFIIALRAWTGNSFDDTSTPSVNEAELVREIMKGARVVFLDRPISSTPASMLDAAVSDLAKLGVQAIPIDQGCGLQIDVPLGPPGAPALSH
jgi:hypothetical protein